MARAQSQTLGLVFFLMLVLVASVFAQPLIGWLTHLFTYRQVQLDLNPINPNFDYSKLVPHIDVTPPAINLSVANPLAGAAPAVTNLADQLPSMQDNPNANELAPAGSQNPFDKGGVFNP